MSFLGGRGGGRAIGMGWGEMDWVKIYGKGGGDCKYITKNPTGLVYFVTFIQKP